MTSSGFIGLAIEEITKSFDGKRAVDSVSLKIPEGEFWCFLGPSGCGKTTLLRMVAGLESPTSGRILMNGRDITSEPAHERNFGMVFQSLALFPHLSVEENVGYALKLQGREARVRRERVAELLELIRLPDIRRRRVDQLSGGQRQRVAIARALAQEPQLFLMDEPLSALDAKLRDYMQVELKQLQQALKITTIFVTHDQREAMTIADKIVVMSDGRVQQVGSPVDIYREPGNRFVAGFIGQSNLLDVEVANPGAVRFADAVMPVNTLPASARAGERITLCVRPEDVRVAELAADALPADVTFVRDLGSGLEVRLDCAGTELIALVGRADWAALSDQTRVGVRFSAGASRALTH
jgi:putative spermidine/putrescine transport system ATP-binding protein